MFARTVIQSLTITVAISLTGFSTIAQTAHPESIRPDVLRTLSFTAGERVARYLEQSTKCSINIPNMNDAVLVGAFYLDTSREGWQAGYTKGLSDFTREYEVSPRMACAAAVMYFNQDVEFVRGQFKFVEPYVMRKYGGR
jgi:hypothetical protein